MLVPWLEVSCVEIVPLGFKPFGSRISLSRPMSDLGAVEFLDGQFSNLSFFLIFSTANAPGFFPQSWLSLT